MGNFEDEKIRHITGISQDVGKAGWPTIRYFNKKTGYGGGGYQQKEQGKVCDELGKVRRMQAYIDENADVKGPGNTPLIVGMSVLVLLVLVGWKLASPKKQAKTKKTKKNK